MVSEYDTEKANLINFKVVRMNYSSGIAVNGMIRNLIRWIMQMLLEGLAKGHQNISILVPKCFFLEKQLERKLLFTKKSNYNLFFKKAMVLVHMILKNLTY